jgi:opacity protein-like surface antigen
MWMKDFVRVLKWNVSDRRMTARKLATATLTALLLALVSSVAMVPSATADDAQETAEAAEAKETIFGRDGVYMGGHGIYGLPYFGSPLRRALQEDSFPATAEGENGWGLGVWLGYRTHGFLAGEIDFEIMDPGFKIDGTPLRTFGLTAYAKAYPLALMAPCDNWLDRFQPYVKAGAGFQYFHTKDADDIRATRNFSEIGFTARFGTGLEFYLSKRLALTFDATYALTTGPISGLNSWSLGVIGMQWRFGPDRPDRN